MTQIYEGMFLLDNQTVREDWKQAKALVTGTVEKHGGTVLTARRWDERRLAYPIKRRPRATYLLTYYRIPAESIPIMRRDFDLSENVLRYLALAVDAVPEGEDELSRAELAADYSVPEPPADDAPEVEPEPEAGRETERAERADRADKADKADKADEADEADEAETGSVPEPEAGPERASKAAAPGAEAAAPATAKATATEEKEEA